MMTESSEKQKRKKQEWFPMKKEDSFFYKNLP